MGPDIRDRLKDAALQPTFDIDVDDLHQHARRTHVRNVAATAVISVVALVAGAALVVSTVTSDPQPPVVGPGEETEQTDADDQRQAELERELEEARQRAHELRREAEREAAREAAAERARQAQRSDWMTDEQKERWEAEHGETQWIVGYFFSPDYQHDGEMTFDGLEARWQPVTDEDEFDRDELLRRSLSALADEGPGDLQHPLNQTDVGTPTPERRITLERAVVEGSRLLLDFPREPWTTHTAMGASGEVMALIQLMAVAAHHYPEADELCILVDGEETYLFSHGIASCPHELP